MASVIKRKKSYSLVYNYQDERGQTRQKWETWHSHKEVMRRKAEVENELNKGTFIPPNGSTVRELMHDFVTLYGEKKWGVSTYESRTAIIANYINPILGDMDVQAITPRAADKYVQTLQKTKPVNPRNKKNGPEFLTPSIIESVIRLLKCAFRQAVRWEMIGKNPFDNVILPTVKRVERDIWTAEVIRHALDHCTDMKLYLAMNLSFACSMRVGGNIGADLGQRTYQRRGNLPGRCLSLY